LCGVRGSAPAVGAEFTRVGGNTSCVAIAHDGDAVPRLILDAGTGLRSVSTLLAGAPFQGTILLGHLHWDHTYGLPFFRAGDQPGAVTTVLVPEQGASAIELVRRFMAPPAFPIGPEWLRGAWTFGSVDEGEHLVEGFTVLAREIPHKGGRTFGYRISDGVGSVAYLSDHGPAGVLGPGPDGLGPYHDAAMELSAGVDVLIHDAQYTSDELPERVDFGHSAAEYAVELARRSGATSVVLFHHDPDRTDDEVDAIELALRARGTANVVAAREGVTIQLPLERAERSA
jgi:phosphoribosyl 1,2-cyclic phosphodiesterase